MATVPMPPITYTPNLPKEMLEQGRLSAVQLEAVALAGQQHETRLPDGSRSTLLCGDGTGLGKGRIAAAVLYDNWRHGRKRLVWVSEKWDLMQDAIRDLRGIGAEELVRGLEEMAGGKKHVRTANAPKPAVRPFNKFPYGSVVKHDGVIFSTYGTVRAEQTGGSKRRRIDQLEQYLRGDDDGESAVLVLDEAHALKNSDVSDTGIKLKALFEHLPNLRILPLSATAATEVGNLGYLDRLGCWGAGTAFPNGFGQFQAEVAPNGLAAMEMVARELKAQGKYVSRTLSYAGVTYDTAKHELNPEQKAIYRTAATAWKTVLQHAQTTVNNYTNGGGQQYGDFSQMANGAQQRFFNLLITSLKTPTCIALANQALADGKSVVISLVNTNEAAQEREKAKERNEDKDDDEPPDYDFGPKNILVDLILKHYPTQQYEDDVNSDGKPVKKPLMYIDDKGRLMPRQNREAVKARDALIAQIDRDLHMPNNPLDDLIDAFGGEGKVAEITGRKEKLDPVGRKLFVQRGDPDATKDQINQFEMRAFQAGKKRVAILSSAGGTGISLHAGNDIANKQKRFMITLQVGWSADKAQQMLGRVHRTNQAQPPEYTFLVSDLAGEQRFVSTITRRISSLGALTKGQKNAAAGSALGDGANIESAEGKTAANSFYVQALRNIPIPGTGLTGMQVLSDLRVLKMDHGELTVPERDRQNVPKLLNRLLALDPDVQNATYQYFFDIFNAAVEHAIEQGTLDTGVKTLSGDQFHVKESKPIAKDPKTGAVTYYYPVDAKLQLRRTSPEDLDQRMEFNREQKPAIVRDQHGKLTLVWDAPPTVHADGQVDPAFYYVTPANGYRAKITQAEFRRVAGRQEIGAWAAGQVQKARDGGATANIS